MLQEGGSGTEATPSSSKMIDFEFSNGQPCGPHVPTSVEDEQYVEYPLDNLAGFPCDDDEEERVSLVSFCHIGYVHTSSIIDVFTFLSWMCWIYFRCSWKR